MSAQQVTIADLASKIDRPEPDIKAWFQSKQSPKVEKQYDQVLWEIQHEQPPWWAPVATPAAAPAAAPAEAVTAQAAEVPAGPATTVTGEATAAAAAATDNTATLGKGVPPATPAGQATAAPAGTVTGGAAEVARKM